MDDQCGQVRRAGLLFIPVVEEEVGGLSYIVITW